MEMTAEQKYLKALAEWLDIETIPKNRIQEASREYLDQFVGVNEKVEPQWKPEVGRLYQSVEDIYECTAITLHPYEARFMALKTGITHWVQKNNIQ